MGKRGRPADRDWDAVFAAADGARNAHEIAAALTLQEGHEVTPEQVRHAAHYRGVTLPRKPRPPRKRRPGETDWPAVFSVDGLTAPALAEDLGLSREAVRRAAKRHGYRLASAR